MAQGWSFAGKRVEFRGALPAGKLVVLGASGAVEHELKLAQAGEWSLPVGTASLKVVRTRQFAGPKLELFSPAGRALPPSKQHLSPSPAPAGSTCAQHHAAASYACARCGSFVCPSCAGADLTHCTSCFDAAHAAAAKDAAAMAYFAPVIVFGIAGGLIGGLLGGLAGAASVEVAKRTESRALKLLAAVGLYSVAAVLYVVVAAMIRRP